LTKLKISEDDERKAIDGQELCAQISKTHKNCRYIENDEDLVRELIQTAKKGDVVIFMGSHGFRGMIDDYISRLEKQK
jgi:UDP-N-acetylmuramate-alanine ligase